MATEYYIDGWHLLGEVQNHNRKIAKTNYLFVVAARPPAPWSNSAQKIFSWNFMFDYFTKIYRGYLIFIKI